MTENKLKHLLEKYPELKAVLTKQLYPNKDNASQLFYERYTKRWKKGLSVTEISLSSAETVLTEFVHAIQSELTFIGDVGANNDRVYTGDKVFIVDMWRGLIQEYLFSSVRTTPVILARFENKNGSLEVCPHALKRQNRIHLTEGSAKKALLEWQMKNANV